MPWRRHEVFSVVRVPHVPRSAGFDDLAAPGSAAVDLATLDFWLPLPPETLVSGSIPSGLPAELVFSGRRAASGARFGLAGGAIWRVRRPSRFSTAPATAYGPSLDGRLPATVLPFLLTRRAALRDPSTRADSDWISAVDARPCHHLFTPSDLVVRAS
jgi:hypothetical protein